LIKNHVACIALNRPEAHNAIDPDTVVELTAAWKEVREDNDVRCAVLTGGGDRTFCSGADLGRLIPLWTGAREAVSDVEKTVRDNPDMAGRALLRGADLNKPVIAAVNGDAIAGGFEFLYGADIRVARTGARFGLQEVKWSVFPAGGSSVHLPRQIPYARAMEILLTGELVPAERMLAWGFLNRVVDKGLLMDTALEYAERIAANGPLAVTAVKQAVRENAGVETGAALQRGVGAGHAGISQP
jgi:enoyl-CoA hydratase